MADRQSAQLTSFMLMRFRYASGRVTDWPGTG